MRHRIGTSLATIVLLAAPSVANAADGSGAETVTWIIGVVTLMAAVVLLMVRCSTRSLWPPLRSPQ